MPLPIPPLSPLRLATPSDINRLAIINTSACHSSPFFHALRPLHTTYPLDTLASSRSQFADCLKNPRYIVLVAVDKYNPEEAKSIGAVIPESEVEEKVEGEEVVVGVGVWILEEGSERIGKFNFKGEIPEFPVSGNRDVDEEQDRIFGEKAEMAHKEYFPNCSELDRLVVHPAYWGRGHGKTLVKWGMELARTDGMAQGVIGPPMGVRLYKAVGFKHLIDLKWGGDEGRPELVLGVLRFEP